MNALELNDFIDTSNAHHALMQTGPINPHWPYAILQAIPFQRGCQEAIAADAASVLVPQYYGFHQLSEVEIGKVVKEICSGLTFLFRQDVHNCQLDSELR